MVVMVTNVNKDRETNRVLNNRKNKEKRIVMLRTDSEFSKLTEISSITGTFGPLCLVRSRNKDEIYIFGFV